MKHLLPHKKVQTLSIQQSLNLLNSEVPHLVWVHFCALLRGQTPVPSSTAAEVNPVIPLLILAARPFQALKTHKDLSH